MAFLYEQFFDGLNTGDLNGQDSWSGDTDFDVTTSNAFQGTKCVTGSSANGTVSRAFTASTSGVAYFAMRHNGTGDASFVLRTSGNTATRISVTFDGTNVVITNGAGSSTLISTYTDNVYYIFEITYNASNQHTARYHNLTSWSSPTATLTSLTNGDVDGVALNQGASGIVFYDFITPLTLTAVQGSIALNGQTATLRSGYKLDAETGLYTLSGFDTDPSIWTNTDKSSVSTFTNTDKT